MTTRVTSATPHVSLDVGNYSLEDILFIPSHNLIVTLSDGPSGLYGKQIRVFDRETDGKPNLIRDNGTGKIDCIVNTVDDVVASLYSDGRIVTWSAFTGNVLSEMDLDSFSGVEIVKIDDKSFAFFDSSGNISVISHDKGNAMKLLLSKNLGEFSYQTKVAACDGIFLVYSDTIPTVWNSKAWRKLGELETNVNFVCVAMNSEMIAAADDFGKLHIYENKQNYSLISTFKVGLKGPPRSLKFIDTQVLMVTSACEGITFVSISQKSRLPIPIMDRFTFLTANCVISNASLCIGGKIGFCAIIEMTSAAASLFENYVDDNWTPSPEEDSNETADGPFTAADLFEMDSEPNEISEVTIGEYYKVESGDKKLRNELKTLRGSLINPASILEMSSAEIASVLAAFMVRYDADMITEFDDIRIRLITLFKREWIHVSSLASEQDEDTSKDRDDIIEVLIKGRTERVAKKMRKRFEEFTNRIEKDSAEAAPKKRKTSA